MYITKSEIKKTITDLEKFFDIVRVVDADLTKEILIEDECMTKCEYNCYAVWHKDNRCENCSSAKSLEMKKNITKFEFLDDKVFFIMSAYVNIEGEECTLELVKELDDNTLLSGYGKNQIVEKIQNFNDKLYIDPLTNVYNRRFYSEQVKQLKYVNVVAVVDVDKFKDVNDNFGHGVGDKVLAGVAKVLNDRLKTTDCVVRIGGDEFLLLFQNMDKDVISTRLTQIQKAVGEISVTKEYPGLNVSISIGAVFGEYALDNIEVADEALYEAKVNRNDHFIKYL